jgi:hypothetical protein
VRLRLPVVLKSTPVELLLVMRSGLCRDRSRSRGCGYPSDRGVVGLVSRLYTRLGAASEGLSSWAHNRLNRGSAGGILARDVVLAPGRECGVRERAGRLVECGVVYDMPRPGSPRRIFQYRGS